MAKDILQTGTIIISGTRTPSIVIPDEFDCDMTFYFKLLDDKEHKSSYTKYTVESPSTGIITITNPQMGVLRPSTSIEVGSYQKKYRLYINYILRAQEEGKDIFDERKLDYCFYISSLEKE